MRQGKWGVAVMLAMMMTACAAPGPVRLYDGAERSVNEVATIRAPEQVQVMAVDGREVSGTVLQRNQVLTVLPGERVFSLRYVQLFQINADEHEVVRSRQAALRFTAEADAEYRIETDKQGSLDAARKFSKAPTFRLVNVKTGAATESTAIKSYAEASLVDTISKAFDSAESKAQGPTHLDLLKDVWGRTSADERAAFRVWMEQQGK